MCLYGTAFEKAEMLTIAANLPNQEIVNPRNSAGECANKNEGMQYWFSVVDGCDALIWGKSCLNRSPRRASASR